ncbi:mitochondrial matrix Mmp37-domain-containing protein [Suillus bovinus]|uniref:mitochondrial matrix Mmp37-domain-containing protein n=1 Tax=Suillus bovinus TaxID=48563 RepID=UPI001B85E7C2|nr:mitochondrial matrix Mmp37-domain-containing protein [Suillus bovinus]KAG2140226.1 mitochondrial matrix Mmp37-domain-containing protein [Suillus bovinus]
MLSTTHSSARRASNHHLQYLTHESLTTDSTVTFHAVLTPPRHLSKLETSKPRQSQFHPRPRPAILHPRQALPTLPPSFGQNQVLLGFNTFVPMKGVYGVTTPLRIIKDDARVRLTQQVNLTSALRTALLMLAESFTQHELFETIAGMSYSGGPRMVLPAENRGKVENMVSR